jgi:hypothetical protein
MSINKVKIRSAAGEAIRLGSEGMVEGLGKALLSPRALLG